MILNRPVSIKEGVDKLRAKDGIKNEILKFILWAMGLFANTNAIDFGVLVLYPAALPISSKSSNHLLSESFSSPLYRIMLFVSRKLLTSSFPIVIPLVSFSCLMAFPKRTGPHWITLVRMRILVCSQILVEMLLSIPHWICSAVGY